jgi:hypothetical protein
VKGDWTEQKGWPAGPEDWKKLQAWIVRRKPKPADAMRATFSRDIAKIFRELYPLLQFTSLND